MTTGAPFARYTSRDLTGHRNKVYCLAWNCSGRKLATGSWDYTTRIWSVDAQGSKPDRTDCELKGHSEAVEQLCWDPSQEYRLATTSPDKTLRIWDARQGKEACKVTTSSVNLNLAWHPAGQHLALGNRDDTVVLLDLRRPNKPLRTHKHSCQVEEIAFTKNGKYFLQAVETGNIEIYRFPTFERTASLAAHTSNAYSLALDPEDCYFASGGGDGMVCLWDAASLTCSATFARYDQPLRSLSFSCDGQYLAMAPDDPAVVEIAHVQTGAPVHTLDVKSQVDFVRWNPRHMLLAYNGEHGRDYGVATLFVPPR